MNSISTGPVLPVRAMVGGMPAMVQYAGGAPGQVAGLMQDELLNEQPWFLFRDEPPLPELGKRSFDFSRDDEIVAPASIPCRASDVLGISARF